ncbi:MAG: FAD-binding monooxygenase [bacterium]|nr:FAD-binding monooxygenase [bacterium]
MQFHHNGYVSGDPRIQPAAGTGLDRPDDLPSEVDVLIVGAGPAGMVAAAQLSQFPGITTRIVDRRDGRLVIGQADGIQARSVETFQAFGFADRIIAEAYRITEMAFWKPDPTDPSRIMRTARTVDDEHGISEFPHLLVNQARVLDYFAEFMINSPTRLAPDYGWEFDGLEVTTDPEYPVYVHLIHVTGPNGGEHRTVRAKYVVGGDGARSRVREAIGCTLDGDQANHAWGVMDVLAVSDFPDIRLKCAIQSSSGSILLIPREGGHLFRMYVDLGEVEAGREKAVRATTIEQVIEKAHDILQPYVLDVKEVAWNSVYEVGHRLTSRFDDVLPDEVGIRTPRVFIAGDACHTHSAKAGQGMNVSMQDGWNLGWKLGHVLEGRSPETLLSTYSAERKVIARNLIDFDKEWSSLMATKPEDLPDPSYLEEFYVRTAEFPAGFMTEYGESMLIASKMHQELAPGFPVGKRFRSAVVRRVCDANDVHLGHLATADGRWRIYVFAPSGVNADRTLSELGTWMEQSPHSPLVSTPDELDADAWFDLKLVYPRNYREVDMAAVPLVFRPKVGRHQLFDDGNVFAVEPSSDVFELRGIGADGAIVVVRPDHYVSALLPVSEIEKLGSFFGPLLALR